MSAGQEDKHHFHLDIQDKQALYLAYMPFIRGGAIFIPTTNDYKLGNHIKLSLQLFDHEYEIIGKVVWITPSKRQRGKKPGIGISILEERSGKLLKVIETTLAGMDKLALKTDTL